MQKFQSLGLHALLLEHISRCKMNKFFQLAVNAVALKLDTLILQHLPEFRYLAVMQVCGYCFMLSQLRSFLTPVFDS